MKMTPEQLLQMMRDKFSPPELTSEEKQAGHNALAAFVRQHPALVATSKIQFNEMPATVRNKFFSWLAAFKKLQSLPAAAFAVVVLFVLGTGTAWAAEYSLPGDLLYPVKLRVTEPLRGITATTPQAKATWQKHRIEKRLTETEQLIAHNQLTEPRAKIVRQAIEQYSQDFVASAQEEGDTDQEFNGGGAEFEETLEVHQRAIVELSQKSPDSSPNARAIVNQLKQLEKTSRQLRSNLKTPPGQAAPMEPSTNDSSLEQSDEETSAENADSATDDGLTSDTPQAPSPRQRADTSQEPASPVVRLRRLRFNPERASPAIVPHVNDDTENDTEASSDDVSADQEVDLEQNNDVQTSEEDSSPAEPSPGETQPRRQRQLPAGTAGENQPSPASVSPAEEPSPSGSTAPRIR